MLFFNKKHNKTPNAEATVNNSIVDMISLLVTKIAPRYPGEIFFFVSDHYTKIACEEFDESYSNFFRAVIYREDVSNSLNYEWALKYFGLNEDQASLLRNAGRVSGRCWQIESNKVVSPKAFARIAAIINAHPAAVKVKVLSSNSTQVSFRCEPA